MTDPLSKHWRQPSTEEILVDDEVALMSDETFDKLYAYNTSLPTALYTGKMWRSNNYLRWCGEMEDDLIVLHTRRIVLI